MKLVGFAFVTFESEDTVDKVVDVHYHDINNKTVGVTIALKRTKYAHYILHTFQKTHVQSNLSKGRIAVLSTLAAANAFVRRVQWRAHSPAAAGEQCGM